MASCADAIELQREILQKIYYSGQAVTTDAALKAAIDALIENMLTVLNGCSFTVDEVLKLRLNVTSASEILIPGIAGMKIVVVHASITASATATDVIFYSSGAVDTELFGPSYIDTAPLQLQANPWGWFETMNGEDLKITKSGGNLGGILGYVYQDVDVNS